MPKVKYVGPFDSVTLAINGIDVKRNHQVEVDEETYASLVEQTDWIAVEDKPKPAKKPAKKATAKSPAEPVSEPAFVGESGPELVELSEGEHITPDPSGEPDEGDKS